MNNPVVYEHLMGSYGGLTVKDQHNYVKASLEDPDDFLYGIFNPEHIGTVRLSGIDRRHGFAQVGICIFRPRFWHKGYGGEALRFIKGEAARMGIRYLEAGVYAMNRRSSLLFERAGFEETHRLKDKYREGEVIYFAYRG
jgi:RimJ/RimL family protein N-acetyltransferase